MSTNYSTYIKQSSANQLTFPLSVDPAEYDFLTFGFYQNGQCIAMYNSYDTEYVKLDEEGEVSIYMLASIAKRFNPSRVSYEVTTWNGSDSELVVGCSFTLDVHPVHDRSSIVDSDDSEITDRRLISQIERILGQVDLGAGFAVDSDGILSIATVVTPTSDGD